MIALMDCVSLAGLVLFFRIPLIIESLYAADRWLTIEPIREMKPWEGSSLY